MRLDVYFCNDSFFYQTSPLTSRNPLPGAYWFDVSTDTVHTLQPMCSRERSRFSHRQQIQTQFKLLWRDMAPYAQTFYCAQNP